MSELEKIAKDLKNYVRYKQENNSEYVSYQDKNSLIIAIEYQQEKNVIYHIDSTKVDKYLDNLKNLKNNLARIIEKELRKRPKEDIRKNIAQSMICSAFKLTNFKDIPEIIRLHKDILT